MRRDLVRGLTLLAETAVTIVWLGWGLADLPNREGSQLVGTLVGAVLLGAGSAVFAVHGVRSVRRFTLVRRLRSDGATGEALVVDVRPTRRRNGRPYRMVALDLRVAPTGEPSFEVAAEESVPVTYLGWLAGKTLPVLVDRTDRRTVVDWEAYESRSGFAARVVTR